MSEAGEIRFISRTGHRGYRNPRDVVEARTVGDVLPALEQIERAVAKGMHAAGFVAYEAAPAFDAALACHDPSDLPLLWFALYDGIDERRQPPPGDNYAVGTREPRVSEAEYAACIARIRDWIASGDTYQVNYTFPMDATFSGSPLDCFYQLAQSQRSDHCAYMDTGRFQLLSASPELFFSLADGVLRTRPMKGTHARGRWTAEDAAFAEALRASEKERAENVMIVDLLRNDMGRISETGSVHVERLFETERYPTVWQMTSTIASRTGANVPEILNALFPSGSVTGAPKIRTMEIIKEIEPHPRGIYCGTMGWWEPGGRAEFNVAIRTMTVDSEKGTATYSVGSGVTWDSSASAEYAECVSKAAVLHNLGEHFDLLESILLREDYYLLSEHLERLRDSATFFDFHYDQAAIESLLTAKREVWRAEYGDAPLKVRLLLSRDQSVRVEAAPAPESTRVRVGFAAHPIDENNVYLFHKTTRRGAYEAARASRPDCDDVILWNARGEATESTTANLVVEVEGKRLTPPIPCALLAGTFRARLLAEGAIEEAVLTKSDVRAAAAIHLINSVRGWIPVEWVDEQGSNR
ncbi:MAG: aminodeoxychorismate synthase component I [Candidatus Hydrogenedentes bacterium]|nr:aminodeoxychorismate synthase component I [Candidatus Hydrogenedentota bacterium]